MSLAMGPVVRLWTRAIYRDIIQAPCWDKPVYLSSDSRSEILNRKQNLDIERYPIWSPSPKIEIMTYSDASGQGWGGYSVQVKGEVAVGSWSEEENIKSPTFRKLRAIRSVLESYAETLKGLSVCHRMDNKNPETIMAIGRRIPELHCEAVEVYKLCRKLNIRLSVE